MKRFSATARRDLRRLHVTEAQIEHLERYADIARRMFTGRAPTADVLDPLRKVKRSAEGLLEALDALVEANLPARTEAAKLFDYFVAPGADPIRFEALDPRIQHLRLFRDAVHHAVEAAKQAIHDVPERRKERDTTSPQIIEFVVGALNAGASPGRRMVRVTRSPGSKFVRVAEHFAELLFGEPHDLDRAIREYIDRTKQVDGERSDDGPHGLDDFDES